MITWGQKKKRDLEEKHTGLGFSIRKVGIGDGIQFTSLPENFFRATGKKLIDVSRPWYLDYNPYVDRESEPKTVKELWNHPLIYPWPHIRDSVYLSNAEIHAGLYGLENPPLIRPRLYRFEDYPFRNRHKILFHPFGNSHGPLPDHVIKHVVNKYDVYQIGLESDPFIPGVVKKLITPTLWDLVREISQCRMLIGVDSGPSWIAACFPDVVVKKIRVKFQYGYCEPKDWVPLDVKNCHSFWDDRCFQIFNIFEDDVGFTYSYNKL